MRFLAWHLGLGDAIAFAELAVKLADVKPLVVPCWNHNEVSVRSIFINHPEIRVEVIDSDRHMQARLFAADAICLGHYSSTPRLPEDDMACWVYRSAGVDLATRWTNPVVAMACRSVKQKAASQYMSERDDCYSIRHDDNARGFHINNIHPYGSGANWWEAYIEPWNDRASILSWADLIEGAKHIHCIDSAFLHLTEQLEPRGKLFYHRYARPGSEAHRFRHAWKVIERDLDEYYRDKPLPTAQ